MAENQAFQVGQLWERDGETRKIDEVYPNGIGYSRPDGNGRVVLMNTWERWAKKATLKESTNAD